MGQARAPVEGFIFLLHQLLQASEREVLVVSTSVMFEGSKCVFFLVLNFRFGRKLSMIRGIVEQEIQEMVSQRENTATHHSHQAWDPVPSLLPATTGMVGILVVA